jgi:C1A family cysteine protease
LPYNQGTLGSCSAHGSAFIYVFEQLKQENKNPIMPSRLDLYYKSREVMGKIGEDSGAGIRDAVNIMIDKGVSIEKDWPYDISKYQQRASDVSYQQSKMFRGITAQKIDTSQDITQDATVNHIKNALLSGQPIDFGFYVYESFESDETKRTGMMPMPGPKEGIVGGHCCVVIGYDDSKQSFLVRNSWGTEWGIGGNFYMPYAFMADKTKTFDLWILTSVTSPDFNPPTCTS